MSWLAVLKNLDTGTTRETEIDTDTASSAAELSESLTQRGDKSAKRGDEGLLSLLALPHIRHSESHASRRGHQAKGNLIEVRPWLDNLKSLEEKAPEVVKRKTNAAPPCVGENSELLVQRRAKSDRSPPPSPKGGGTSGANTIDVRPKETRRTLVISRDQLAEVMAGLNDVTLVALDLETTGLNLRNDSIRLLSLATNDATYIVDCQQVNPAGIFPILVDRTLIAHNALFDLGFLSSLGFEPSKVADTMILSQLFYAGSRVEPLKRGQTSHSLDFVVERELGLELDKAHQSSDWDGTLTPEMIEYAARDVEVLLPLYESLRTKIEDADLTYVAEIEHRALPAVVWMSSAGVPIDAVGWREHARKTEANAERLKDELNALAPEHPDGGTWNFGSHQQVRKTAKLLGVDLPDTRDETLALYAAEHGYIAALRGYRKVAKLASTYGAGWLDSGHYRDGRIYASWRQLRATTGRMVCDHPNLQNIPRSGPLRSYIRAPEGRIFVIADYSQIELRIAAKISGDPQMLNAYVEGDDLHILTAQNLTGREEISNDDRKLAKAVNFGLLYGMGAQRLQSYALKNYGVSMSSQDASLYRRRFFETYPDLKRWHDNVRWAWQSGETETRTLTGRRRKDIEKLTDRLNAPVQGAAADGLKLALALLWERRSECLGATPVLACHDEVVVECDAEQAADAKAWLEKTMIEGMEVVMNSAGEVCVPVEVEARIARSWGAGDWSTPSATPPEPQPVA
jgi:DNA polymerase-1